VVGSKVLLLFIKYWLCKLIYLSCYLIIIIIIIIIIIDIFRAVYFFCQSNCLLLWYFINHSNILVTCYDVFVRISYTVYSRI